MLIPNAVVHSGFGKLLFSMADVLLGWGLYKVLNLRKVHRSGRVVFLNKR